MDAISFVLGIKSSQLRSIHIHSYSYKIVAAVRTDLPAAHWKRRAAKGVSQRALRQAGQINFAVYAFHHSGWLIRVQGRRKADHLRKVQRNSRRREHPRQGKELPRLPGNTHFITISKG